MWWKTIKDVFRYRKFFWLAVYIVDTCGFSMLRAGGMILACAESYLILGIAIVAPPIKFTLKFRHRQYLSPIFHLFSCYLPSIGKNEAIQLFRSLIFHAAMTDQLAPALRSKILRLLLLHWRPDVIAEEVHCHFTTVYRFQENLFMYGSSFKPQFRLKGAPRKVFPAAEDSLITYLEQQPWAMQKEMVWFLWEEWGIHVHRSTISRILKKRH